MKRNQMIKSHWLKSVVVVLCSSGMLVAAPPQEIPSPDSQGIAVLVDGRVMKGKIQEIAGGYVIKSELGSITVPYDQISMTAASLDLAYESYRSLITEPTADVHLRLARWCMANGLWPQAYTELNAALKLDPRRQETHQLLKQIDKLVHVKGDLPDSGTVKHGAMSVQTFAPTQKSAEGFNPETRVQFSRVVQPILMNSCVAGGCHGHDSETGLKLTKVSLSSPNLKTATENNQAALMEWINFSKPDQSPLLVRAVDGSDHHAKNFKDRQNKQYAEVLKWVREVVQQSPDARKIAESRPTSSAGTIQQASGIQPESASKVMNANAEFKTLSSDGWEGVNTPTAPDQKMVPFQYSPELDQARKQNRGDAFDPRKFNEMMMKAPPQGQQRIPR